MLQQGLTKKKKQENSTCNHCQSAGQDSGLGEADAPLTETVDMHLPY